MKTNFFYSDKFLLLVLSLVMLNNLENSATVYYHISSHGFGTGFWEWARCVGAVIILDLSIIAFVIHGKHKTALVYSIAVAAINWIYSGGINIFFLEDLPAGARINDGIAKGIFALMFTYSIYIFSKMYWDRLEQAADQEASPDPAALLLELQEKEKNRQSLIELVQIKDADYQSIVATVQQLEMNNLQLGNQLEQHRLKLQCKSCGYVAESAHALSGHKKHCKGTLFSKPGSNL